MDEISSNLANISTTHNEAGEAVPCQAKIRDFPDRPERRRRGAPGVKVSGIQTSEEAPRMKFDPGNPDAIKEGPQKGMVAYPNVDMMHEFTDSMEAARAYEANLGAIEITKDLQQQTLKIIA